MNMSAQALNTGHTSSSSHPWTGNPGLKKLCTLLRNEGDRVLSGNSVFTLTTEVLSQLNTNCRRHSITESDIVTVDLPAGSRSFLPLTSRLRAHQEAARAKEEWSGHVQFIKDFMLSTPSLKLIRYSGTLSSPISLHRFSNLTCLQLRKVPIHMVEGLHRLRGVLVSVTVYRCVDKVKDLLECCGGDMTAPMVWPQLKYISFMFNSISSLDDSLRLLTHSEVLDLSHNSLETCDTFLEYLGDIHHITLAYNFLTSVPSVSVTARASLTCLVLRGNNIDDIRGVDVLTALQSLDLGENCINDHGCLYLLGSLLRLKQLQLDGNPVFYHKQHRLLTVACLALRAVSVQFELDKKKLTASEISKAHVKRNKASHLAYVGSVGARSHTPDNDCCMSASSGIGTENESADSGLSYKSQKKSRRKKLRARHMEISDLEHSDDLTSSRDATPGTSPHPFSLEQQLRARREEAMRTQQQVEELRKHYGSNWLQAIEDRDIFNKKKTAQSAVTSESSDVENTESEHSTSARFFIGTACNHDSDEAVDSTREAVQISSSWSEEQCRKEVFPTDDDLYLTDTRMSNINNPIMAAIARLAAGDSSDSTEEEHKHDTELIFPSAETQTSYNIQCTNTKALIAETPEPVLQNNKSQIPNQFAANHISTLSKPIQPLPAARSDSEADALDTSDLNSSAVNKTKTSSDAAEISSYSSSVLVEEDEVTEPMFATLPFQDNEMIIITLTPSYLVEKDIRGKVTEKLDLAILIGLDWRKVTRPTSQSDACAEVLAGVGDTSKSESVQLDLRFDYVRKDRQLRNYVVDVTDANAIHAYLRPFLELKEDREKAKLMTRMQCLKCNRTFLKGELIQQRSQLPTSGSSKDLQSLKELMNKTTVLCPKCGSSLIIELQQSTSGATSTGSAVSTPVGSYTSLPGSYMDQFKRPASLVRKKSSDKFPASVMTVRDRTSGLVTDTRALANSVDHIIPERDELVCIEDHFAANNMTNIPIFSDSPDMTTSLQGDTSTRGKMAFVKRLPLKETQDLDYRESSFAYEKPKHLIDSGYESNIVGGLDTSSKPIAIEKKASSRENESYQEKDTDKMRSESRRSSTHTNLAALENIVNSLVKEGKCLEEEGVSSSSYSNSSKGKSVSISAFMKSSSLGHNRTTSIGSPEGGNVHTGLKHSESSSSIAVIPVPTLDISFEALSSMRQISSSLPSEGTHVNPDVFIADSERSASTVSPLSSNICSSMVSSIYETSVNNPAAEDDASSHVATECDVHGPDSTDGIQALTDGVVMMVGSSSSSTEDLTSIYDHPKTPQLSSRRKSHSKHQVPLCQSPVRSGVNGNVEHSVGSVSDLDGGDAQSSAVAITHRQISSHASSNKLTVSDSAAAQDEGNDTDEGNEEELVPQYAFQHLNHRLTLYMMMSLFTTEEEFVCKLQAEVVQYIVEKSYEGFLVMSSSRFYILKITSKDHSQPPDHWLQCVEIQPIPELRHIDIGLGGQTFRLEFVTDCSSYTFVTRNRDKTQQFVELLHTHLAKYAVSQGIASLVLVSDNIDETTLSNLDRDVVSKVTPDQKMLFYCMGFIERGKQKLFPVSFVVTTCDLCLVCVNQQWPQPRLQAPICEETVGKQFTVLERQKVTNVASVEVCETTMKKLRLELFNETEGVSTNWNISLATRQSTVDFINALSQPWAHEFGVEMDVVYADLSF